MAGVPVLRAKKAVAKADRWMVVFGPTATSATLEAFCSQRGPCLAKGHPDKGGVPFVAVERSEAALEASITDQSTDVKFVEQDAVVELFEEKLSVSGEVEERTPRALSWGLAAIGVSTARAKGQGVNVYVLDTGVRVTHQDFGGRAVPLFDASRGTPLICNPADTNCARDRNGHGTHVAGTVGGVSYGVAPAATIWAMCIAGRYGMDAIMGYSAIDWLAVNRQTPAVLQMSWGGSFNGQVAQLAVDAAVARGVTVTVASGNSNTDACGWIFGGFPNVISVASSDLTMSRSPFSNYGPCIDIFAPGTDIRSLNYFDDTGSTVMSGTSMAAPHVAGAAALILELNPELEPQEVKERLLKFARQDAIGDCRSSNNFLQVWSIEAVDGQSKEAGQAA